MAKQAAIYFIASISYWSGDFWSLESGTETTRVGAEKRLQTLRDQDFPLNIKVSRKYRIMTMSEVKREFGVNWYDRVRQTANA